ncbi:MAG: hypothetical protein AAF487_15280 [Bacteroidota bacterium]
MALNRISFLFASGGIPGASISNVGGKSFAFDLEYGLERDVTIT